MDEQIESSSDELLTLNVDDLDIEELSQRLELAVDAGCDCWGNGCSSYCNPPAK